MLFYVQCSIKKRKIKNLITVAICMALVILLSLYFGSMHSYETQLRDFAKNVPVYCQITNANGSRETGLFISDSVVQGLKASELVTEEHLLACVMAGEGEVLPDQWMNINLFVDGANRIEAVPGLTEENLHLEQGNAETFFTSEQLECVVSQYTMDRRGWNVGDQILLSFYYFVGDNSTMTLSCYTNPLQVVQVKIVGTMEASSAAGGVFPDIVLPYETIRQMYLKNDVTFLTDTVSFRVADPLRLNEFKAQMLEFDLQEKSAEAQDSFSGYTLAVKDNQFIAAATQLRQAGDYMQAFLPIVMLMVLLIGYVVSNLLSSSRMEEFVLLRLQGMESAKAAFGFWLEQVVLILAGIAAGDILVGLFYSEVVTIMIVNGVLLTAYFIGAAAAYARMGNRSVMQLLSGK